MRKVVIHYFRADQDYKPWGVWVWPEGYGGAWAPFSAEDEYGKIAQMSFPKEHRRIGFLIRGASWEKDIAHDRYIEYFIGDLGEIWLIAGDPRVYLVPPVSLRSSIRAFDQVELIVHYYRYDGDYRGWNLWAWAAHEWGRSLQFEEEDDYGYLARTSFSQQTDASEIGLVVRLSTPGQKWLAKDGGDRLIPLYRADDRGKLEVWLLQADPQVYYRQADVQREPCLLEAKIDDERQIRVQAYLPILAAGETRGFELLQAGEKPLGIEAVRPLGVDWQTPSQVLIKTKEPLDLNQKHILRHQTHGERGVGFGKIFTKAAFRQQFHYAGSDLGVTYSPQQTVLRVWAPTAWEMAVVLYAKGRGGRRRIMPMRRDVQGTWVLKLQGDWEGFFYNFLVRQQEETKEAVDPYARAAGVNGRRGQIVDLKKTNPPGWGDMVRMPLANPVDAIIYEVHVRDFSISPQGGFQARGQYLAFQERGTATPLGISTGLDHLKDLGITHVHLLPVFDFATVDEANPHKGYNWGYDPQNYNVPEGSYASDPFCGPVRIRELKKLILSLKQAGIGVILDVVYNHTFHSLDSSLNRLVPGYYYRQNADGSFANGSGCGNELADERSMVRKLIVDSLCYWAREYQVSGFRFDLMGLHHLETMGQIRKALDQIDPQILIYGEGWAAGPSPLAEQKRAVRQNTPYLAGIASFCNDFRDGLKGHVFHNREKGFIQGGGWEETVKFGLAGATAHPQIDYRQVIYSKAPWAIHPGQAVLYAEAHDNLTLWDKLLCTTEAEDEWARLAMMKLAHTLILTGQGIPFLHAGQEFARTKGGDPNSYQSPDQVNQLNWERKGHFGELYEFTRALIALRKKHPAFRLRTGEEVREKLRFLKMPAPNMIGFALGPHANGDAYETILVFVNSNRASYQVKIPPGQWRVLANQKGVGPARATLGGPFVELADLSPLILGKEGE